LLFFGCFVFLVVNWNPIQKLYSQFIVRFFIFAAFFSHHKSSSTVIGQLIFRVCFTMTSRWHKHLQMWNFICFLQERWHRHFSTKPVRFPGFVRFCFLAAFVAYENSHQKFIGKLFFSNFFKDFDFWLFVFLIQSPIKNLFENCFF